MDAWDGDMDFKFCGNLEEWNMLVIFVTQHFENTKVPSTSTTSLMLLLGCPPCLL